MADFEWPWERKEREKREAWKRGQEERERLERIEQDERRILREEERIERDEREILRELHRAQSASLVIQTGTKREMNMPATLVVGQTAQAVYKEFSLPNQQGVELPPAGAPAFATSDGSIATVDPVTGVITAVAAGNVVITGSDAVNGLNASDTGTVTGIQAQSASLTIVPNNDAPAAAASLKK